VTARAQAALPTGPTGAVQSSTGPVLELDQVTKVYPGSPPVTALARVSLTVTAGELVAIVGPSGSGKTTLLHLAGSLDRPTSGTVRVAGLDVAGLSDRELAGLRAASIGFVFQQFFLAEQQTVLDNVADRLLYAGAGPGKRRERALRALHLVGLAGRPYARPTQLSGGQRQRVAIARLLVQDPEILLADEPAASLDPRLGRKAVELLVRLSRERGKTLIVSLHDIDLVSDLFDRVLALKDGAWFWEGWPAELNREKIAAIFAAEQAEAVE